ncbi:type II toxin-antitoxin system PemK/MazF family toxin [Curtobacterium sp. MCLR17_054]|uniref:type II toxin-antitoxin system PemK/MazF family toxin n=1 Tax=Curtobacterium sp. MCLR17_054 TaxID=2175632 RepID=UPI0015E8D8F9|nr:type II toxin-antitoxin system PemK/MazF family toxin [Curtobacterium sp. MCLR17_054]WIE69214.1 type II toxin-antitoxin system PemK/MazF family toxin [Curtobacterium sp. MCLR17_054]
MGGIYLVKEDALTLPPEASRTKHAERRPFVVLSGAGTNSRIDWKTVLGCPISSSTSYRTEFDVKLAQGEFGATKKCWIRIPALQPILKTDLEDLTGTLDAARLEEAQARVLEFMGLTDED